jgi:hypothetical protein
VGRYLKAAFWLRASVPGLGRLPLNALALLGFGILGLGHPGFWLIGLGAEAAWLLAATSSDRFRTLIDAETEQIEQGTTEEMREALVARLADENRERLKVLEQKSRRALALQRDAGVSEIMREMNEDSLHKLTWFFLKLLVARENLQALGDASARRDLEKKVTGLERELEGRVSFALRESKEATLKILRQRLAHVDRREESIAEIDSDLTRIEAQIDLAVDNAGLRGKRSAVSADIHFVSQFLDDAVFGEASVSITALDQTYSAAPSRKVAE